MTRSTRACVLGRFPAQFRNKRWRSVVSFEPTGYWYLLVSQDEGDLSRAPPQPYTAHQGRIAQYRPQSLSSLHVWSGRGAPIVLQVVTGHSSHISGHCLRVNSCLRAASSPSLPTHSVVNSICGGPEPSAELCTPYNPAYAVVSPHVLR